MVAATKNIWDEAEQAPATGDIWEQAANTNKAFDDLMTGVLEIQELPGWPLTGILDKDIAARAGSAMYYHYETGIPPDQAYDLVDQLGALQFGRELPAETMWGRVKQSYASGKAATQLGELGMQLSADVWSDPQAFDKNLSQVNKLTGQIGDDWLADERMFLERLITGPAEQIPQQIKMAKSAGKYGMVGAIVGGLAGTYVGGPGLGATAFKVIGSAAATYGAFDQMRKLEGGHAFIELMLVKDKYGNRMDPKIASAAANIIGTFNGAVEVAEFATLLSAFGIGTKIFENAAYTVASKMVAEGTLRHIAVKYMTKFGYLMTVEQAQEFVQESSNIYVGMLAQEINDRMKGTEFKKITGKDIQKRYREIIEKTFYATAGIVGAGTGSSFVFEAITGQKPLVKTTAEPTTPVAPVVEKLAPKPPEAVTEAVKPETIVSDEEYAAVKTHIAERQKAPSVAQEGQKPAELPVPTPQGEIAAEQAPAGAEGKEAWEMTRGEIAQQIGYKGSLKSEDINRAVKQRIQRSNELQKETNKMFAQLVRKGLSEDAAWKQVKDSSQWQEFTAKQPDLNQLQLHERYIRDAIKQGKPVPAAVLAEYPDLIPKELKIAFEMEKSLVRKLGPAFEKAKQAPAPEAKETGKLPGGRQAGGTILLSPQEWADAITAGYYHLQHGAQILADWSAKMIADFGESIRPHLQALWDEIHGVKKVAEKPPEKTRAKRKKSKLTRRIEKRLKQEFAEAPGYEGMSMADQAAKVKKMWKEDPERVKRIAMGQEEPPQGLRVGSVYKGLEVIAVKEGDVDTLRDLAVVSTTTTASEFGQQVKAFDVPIENDPVRAMQEVAAVREKAVSKRMRVKDTKAAKKAIAKEIKAEITKQAKISKWEAFILELQC